MSGLSSMDVRGFNEAALELHATQTPGEFPGQICKAVRMIMSGDIVVVDWINSHTSISMACQYFPAGTIPEELNALAHVLLPAQSPFWLQCADDPHSVSDFMTRAQWSRRDIFWALRQADQEDCLCLDVRLTASLTLMVVVLRGSYGSFVTSDRLTLKLLGPHVRQVYRRLLEQGPRVEGRDHVLRHAEIRVGEDGRNCHWSSDARELLLAQGVLVFADELPSSLMEWFMAQRRALENPLEVTRGVQPLTFKRGARKLTLYLLRNSENHFFWLVLQETEAVSEKESIFPGLDISRRESEVLYWLSQGKSNSEIAGILGVSAGTIGRHLENLFPKLGVDNRYAASLMATAILISKTRATIPREANIEIS